MSEQKAKLKSGMGNRGTTANRYAMAVVGFLTIAFVGVFLLTQLDGIIAIDNTSSFYTVYTDLVDNTATLYSILILVAVILGVSIVLFVLNRSSRSDGGGSAF